MTWQHWAEKLDGRTYTTDDGVEVVLRVQTDARGYTSIVEGNPTKHGRSTPYYQARRREYHDDWSYCWQGELPESLCTLVQ